MSYLPIKRLTQELLDSIAQQARSSPRLRQNHNFHEPAEKVQRFLNVLQPGTYVRPHRHQRADGINGFEFFLVIQGELGILILDESGQLLHKERVAASGLTRGVELPEGTYHTLVALAADTVILELKEGPYNAHTDKEFIDVFPPEGTLAARQLVDIWQGYFRELVSMNG
ncbi:MAG: WbuC family cupin fold metalloprotein [Chroococcidiopsidaceae cyanobacterium CP_BM_RX_35]|nr:WbuC family cupin fold metalloprotein [Chroococcidiopsidaceae cyanobacterium CP_BM_RX_35]